MSYIITQILIMTTFYSIKKSLQMGNDKLTYLVELMGIEPMSENKAT
jgi:hypothetical protein